MLKDRARRFLYKSLSLDFRRRLACSLLSDVVQASSKDDVALLEDMFASLDSAQTLVENRIRQIGFSGRAVSIRRTPMPTWLIEAHAAKYLRRLFYLLEVDCVIDVGANLGQYCTFLRRDVGYGGAIISFEPIPSHAQILEDHARSDPNWHVEGCALGAVPGRVKFNVMTESQFSSFLTPNHEEVTLFRDKNKVYEQIEVEVKTLDTIIPMVRERYRPRNIYLKLDTQGFDLEIIRGAEKKLSDVIALQFEASIRQIYDGAPRYDEVIRYCETRGFLMSGIFPNNAGHFPILVEFDCFMVRQEWGDIEASPTGTHRAQCLRQIITDERAAGDAPPQVKE